MPYNCHIDAIMTVAFNYICPFGSILNHPIFCLIIIILYLSILYKIGTRVAIYIDRDDKTKIKLTVTNLHK